MSLDWVELVMAMEEEIGCDLTDDFAETFEQRTFRELVEHLYANRRDGR
jgi:acyl carrier protein